MLVLISFGLVLVATVLLVLGLVANGGLGLIYASIACSVVAGIALVVATVIRRPSDDMAPAAGGTWAPPPQPAPMATPASVSAPASEPTAPVPVVPAPAPAYTPARQGALATVGASAAAASSGSDEDFFPIEDYDDLRVAEILPLIPELYPDQKEMVEQRELETKARTTVLDRIAEVRSSQDGGAGGQVAAPAAVASDDDDFFPIEDYDDLRVAEILPLLGELYPEEMDQVERYERAGKGRVSIINRLAELRDAGEDGGENAPAAVDDDEPGDDMVAEADEDFFPIEDYEELTVGEILPLLPELYEDELDVVEERERATKNRAVVINRLAELRDAGEDGGEDAPAAVDDDELGDEADEQDWSVPDEGWDRRRASTPAAVADEVPVDEDVFPIEDYDNLRVPEIRSALPQLTEEELEEVRSAERRGSNRVTVLTAIDRELGVDGSTARRAPAKKAARRTGARKIPGRPAATKSTAEKATAKKATAKKSPARKSAAKKAATKRATPKRAATKRATPKRAATKRAATKRAATKRAATKRAAPKKAGSTKRAAKKATATKAGSTKRAAKKSTAKKATAKRAGRRP